MSARVCLTDDCLRHPDAVRGRKLEDVWPIIDELMLTLQVIQPRLYNAVMAKIGY